MDARRIVEPELFRVRGTRKRDELLEQRWLAAIRSSNIRARQQTFVVASAVADDIVDVMRVALVLLLLTDVALAKPPPSGLYRMERRGPATMVARGPKGSKRIPECKTAESQPVPEMLRIEYSVSLPTVNVNAEEWTVGGFTTGGDGKPSRDPHQTADKPNQPPNLRISVWFAATNSNASGLWTVIVLDNKHAPACTVSYRFEGSFR